jgi:exonuclease III
MLSPPRPHIPALAQESKGGPLQTHGCAGLAEYYKSNTLPPQLGECLRSAPLPKYTYAPTTNISTHVCNISPGTIHTRLPAGRDAGPLTVRDTLPDASGEFGDGAAVRVTQAVRERRQNGDQPHNNEDGLPLPIPDTSNPSYQNCLNPQQQDNQGRAALPNCDPNRTREGRSDDNRQWRVENRLRRAHIYIATLNMKGQSSVVDGVNTSKWGDIENMMKVRCIGILAVQETHLALEDLEDLANLHQRRLVILNSADSERPTQLPGVAFAINREVVRTNDIEIEELIPGRALLLGITWQHGQHISVLNVYAPNDKTEQIAFWNQLYNLWGGGRARHKPDFMMGDFNATKDPIDRAPARRDDKRVVTAMRDTRTVMGLVDAWRHTHVSIRQFTFTSHRCTLTCIDCICSKPSYIPFMYKWETASPAVCTDHCMVSAHFAPEDSPEVGSRWWTWP